MEAWCAFMLLLLKSLLQCMQCQSFSLLGDLAIIFCFIPLGFDPWSFPPFEVFSRVMTLESCYCWLFSSAICCYAYFFSSIGCWALVLPTRMPWVLDIWVGAGVDGGCLGLFLALLIADEIFR